jgi:TRAP-type mannitol/chloroaromatic compound transport system substrate-binding protein
MMGSGVAHAKPGKEYECQTQLNPAEVDIASELEWGYFFDRLGKQPINIDVADPIKSSSVFEKVHNGEIMFGYGLPQQVGVTGLPSLGGAMGLYFGFPFGFEASEFLSWYYGGYDKYPSDPDLVNNRESGQDLQRRLYEQVGYNVHPILLRPIGPESGGWFKEKVTKRLFSTQEYSTGEPLQMRLFGLGRSAMEKAFPALAGKFPEAVGGVSALTQFGSYHHPPPDPNNPPHNIPETDVFTALEYGAPGLDNNPTALFPASGDIISKIEGDLEFECYKAHYYLNSWFTPWSSAEIWINKDFWDKLPDDKKEHIELAARGCAMQNIANQYEGQGKILKKWQDMGAIIHESYPEPILEKLRAATVEALNDKAIADPYFAEVLENMKQFAKNEQNRFAYGNVPKHKRFGFSWDDWESILD